MKIFCDASNMHIGGGKTLILDFINAAKDFLNIKFYIFVDTRLEIDELKQNNIKFITVNKFLRQFVCFYINLKAYKNDYVIYLGNIPPILRSKCFTTLFMGNRYLIDNISTKEFDFKSRIRINFERFLYKIFKNNDNETIIQSKSMQQILIKKIKTKNKIKIFPFFNKKIIVTDKSKKYVYDFIYIASDEPHKNHINLLESWYELSQQKIYPSLCLTLPQNSFLIKKIKKIISLDSSINIVIKSNLNNNESMFLLKYSKALIFPSYFESFGLPLIEAQNLNIDIIASEKDFVRDIIDPIETFDPSSFHSITRAVKRYLKMYDMKTEVKSATDFIDYLLKNKSNNQI